MAEVYFYMPADKMADAVECGIKLSEWYSREVRIGGEVKRCITALLNPRDDSEIGVLADHKCLKLEVHPKYCYVADSLLYKVGLEYPEVMELYEESIVPMEQYMYGSYRLPEILITGTVLGDQISLPGKWLDTPVLYSNSQDLYFGSLFESMQEEYEDINDALLYLFFKMMYKEGKADMIEDPVSGLAVFTRHRDERVYTLKIPNFRRY